MFQLTNYALGGGDQARGLFNSMNDELAALEGIDLYGERIQAEWDFLKTKRKG